jgi:hypothetical protein
VASRDPRDLGTASFFHFEAPFQATDDRPQELI